MKSGAYFFSILLILALSACVKHGPSHQKIQPAKVDKSDGTSGISRVTLTPEAKARLAIKSETFRRSPEGKRTVPVSALIYDTSGASWVFVETSPAEFHREQIRVLRTQGSQIQVESNFDDSIPVVIQGAAELSGTESGVGK